MTWSSVWWSNLCIELYEMEKVKCVKYRANGGVSVSGGGNIQSPLATSWWPSELEIRVTLATGIYYQATTATPVHYYHLQQLKVTTGKWELQSFSFTTGMASRKKQKERAKPTKSKPHTQTFSLSLHRQTIIPGWIIACHLLGTIGDSHCHTESKWINWDPVLLLSLSLSLSHPLLYTCRVSCLCQVQITHSVTLSSLSRNSINQQQKQEEKESERSKSSPQSIRRTIFYSPFSLCLLSLPFFLFFSSTLKCMSRQPLAKDKCVFMYV